MNPPVDGEPIPRRRWLSVSAAAVAFSAFAGAAGLMTGQLALGHRIDARLPFRSPVIGGLALAAVVGAPFATLAVTAWRRSPLLDHLAVLAGGLLIGWIAVEIAVVRSFSPLQPLFAAVGAIFVIAGRSAVRRPASARHRGGTIFRDPSNPGGQPA